MRAQIKRGCITLLLIIGAPTFVASSDATGYAKIMDRFFDLPQQGKTPEAIDFIYGTNPYSEKVSDQVSQIKTQLVSQGAIFGKYRGHEVVIERMIAQRYVYMVVSVAYDRQPLKMEFHFYRPGDKWVLQAYSYGTDLDDDIARFAKYDLVK
ncbi:MAG: hypothetical protein ACE5HU_00325 [Acidobacteriota bacterium]